MTHQTRQSTSLHKPLAESTHTLTYTATHTFLQSSMAPRFFCDCCVILHFLGRNGDPGGTEVSRPILRTARSRVTSPVPSLLPLLEALSSVLGAPGTDTWLLLGEQRESLLSTACAQLQLLHLPEALPCPSCIGMWGPRELGLGTGPVGDHLGRGGDVTDRLREHSLVCIREAGMHSLWWN
jgi:hypothetical protein